MCGYTYLNFGAFEEAIWLKLSLACVDTSSVIASDLHVYLETNTNSSSFSASFVRGLPFGRLLYL